MGAQVIHDREVGVRSKVVFGGPHGRASLLVYAKSGEARTRRASWGCCLSVPLAAAREAETGKGDAEEREGGGFRN